MTVGEHEAAGAPFSAVLPFQLVQYPVPQLMTAREPAPPEEWPPPMPPKLQAWAEQTAAHRPAGNAIYVHVPFCPFFCHFCPLYKTKDPKHRGPDAREAFVQRIVEEIQRYGRVASLRGLTYDVVYFGGGTPTELTAEQLGRILTAIREAFVLAHDAEITLESVAARLLAPGYFEACVRHGFNRISFGVQTLDPKLRKLVGRGEKLSDYQALLEMVRAHDPSFPINVDLMIGLPEQTPESFRRDLEEVLAWNVGSLDIYAFWMVPGTRTFELVVEGNRQGPSYGDGLLEMRRMGQRILRDAGFQQVAGEVHIRNDHNRFIRTSFGGGGNALHTLLGFGPSAIGMVDGTLYRNICDLDAYSAAVDSGCFPVGQACTLDVATARRRAVMLNLERLAVPEVFIQERRARRLFEQWQAHGLVDLREGVYHLTDEGSHWYNQMQLELLPFWEMVKMAGIMGSMEEQRRAFSVSEDQMPAMTRQLRDFIRKSSGIKGWMRLAGYKTLLRLKQLPFLESRGVSFTGPVESRKRLPMLPARTTNEGAYVETD